MEYKATYVFAFRKQPAIRLKLICVKTESELLITMQIDRSDRRTHKMDAIKIFPSRYTPPVMFKFQSEIRLYFKVIM